MRILLVIGGILIVTTDMVSATVCTEPYGTTCVSAVKSLLLDQSAFWFGTSYTSVCPQRQDGRLECLNRHSDRTDSLLSRMTGQYALDPAYMNFVINVTYTIRLPPDGTARTYNGCGVKVTAPLVTPPTFSIDPLNTTLYRPFDVISQPEVTWPSEANAKYTVILYDASFFSVNALYVNVHGGTVTGGETAVNYTGPVNPLPRESPYVWAVFEQQGVLQTDDVTNYIQSAMLQDNYHTVYLDDFITRFSLLGPYGVNIVRMTTDEYASVVAREEGIINRCPIYYGRWLGGYIADRGGLPYLPFPLALSVSVDLTFTTPDTTYTVCCQDHFYRAAVTTLDYHHYDSYGSLPYSNTPSVSLYTVQNPNTTSQTLANKMYTLLLVDSNTATNTTLPLLHWAVVNIHGADVTSGEQVIRYLVPAASSKDSLFLLILLEQITYLNASAVSRHTGGSCQLPIVGRCNFRVDDFLQTNSLTVVGIRKLGYTPESYRKYLLYKVFNASTESAECAGDPQYAQPCPSASPYRTTATTVSALVLISLTTASLLL